MASFGKRLIKLRKSRQLTQIELAELVDVQPRLVVRWELDEGKPQFDYVVKLADALEVSLDYLIRGTDSYKPPAFDVKNKKLKTLCKKVDQLSKNDQDMVCQFLEKVIRE